MAEGKAAEKEEPLIHISVIRVNTDYGINFDDFPDKQPPDKEDRHSATVTLLLRLRPMESQNMSDLPDINDKVEAIVSGLNAMNEVAREEHDRRLKERYPTIKTKKPE